MNFGVTGVVSARGGLRRVALRRETVALCALTRSFLVYSEVMSGLGAPEGAGQSRRCCLAPRFTMY